MNAIHIAATALYLLTTITPGIYPQEPHCPDGQRWLYIEDAGIHACDPVDVVI